MLKRMLYYLLSPKFRLIARRLYYLPVDIWEKLIGRRDNLTPPKGSIFIGSGDFNKTGQMYLNRFIELAGLKPEHRLLDIGCGIGRIAIPLTKYLNEKGSYEGFDIVKTGINWCIKHIHKTYPNFNFLHIDLKNDLYNLSVNREARNFIFPYNDNDFDMVVLTSVFTHMLPIDVENYLNQLHRVLKPSGKCLVTFFVLNTESKLFMNNSSSFIFKHSFENYSLMNSKVKEANVAYEETSLEDCFNKNNLEIDKVYYGWWSGRDKENSLDFQDTYILVNK